VVFEVTIDAGPERRVFDERRRTAPPWLVVKTEGVRPEHVAYAGEVPQRDAARLGGRAVGGARLDQTQCRTVDECVERIVEDYRSETEKMRELPPNPAEELLREWPELEAFGTEWVRKWLDLRERLVEIAKVLRKFPWMVEVMRQRPMSILHPYTVEVYVAKDGSEACLSLNPPKAFCARGGAVKEVKLELAFSRYEVYEERIRGVYRPRGLLAFTTAAKECVRLL
jgi:hypothetical protein